LRKKEEIVVASNDLRGFSRSTNPIPIFNPHYASSGSIACLHQILSSFIIGSVLSRKEEGVNPLIICKALA